MFPLYCKLSIALKVIVLLYLPLTHLLWLNLKLFIIKIQLIVQKLKVKNRKINSLSIFNLRLNIES